MEEIGTGLISTALNTGKEQVLEFLKADDSKTSTKEEDDEYLIIPEPEKDRLLTKKELDLKNEKNELRKLKLQIKVNNQISCTRIFYEIFSDPEIESMLEKYDANLFLDEKNITKMRYTDFNLPPEENQVLAFKPEYFTGKQKSLREMFVYLRKYDIAMTKVKEQLKLEAKKKKEPEPPEWTPFETRLWQKLNNIYLICKTLQLVDKPKLQTLLTFICNTYDEFMAGKIEDIRLLPQRIIDKIKETTNFDQKSASSVSDFIMEAVYHNCGSLKDALDMIKKNMPACVKDIAAEKGYDIEKMQIEKMMLDTMENMKSAREKKKNGELEDGQNVLQPWIDSATEKANNLASGVVPPFVSKIEVLPDEEKKSIAKLKAKKK